LAHYNNSVFALLSSIYPDSEFLPFLFHSPPKGLWDNKDNHSKYLNYLGGKLGFKTREDWYKLTRRTVKENGGNELFQIYGDVYHLVNALLGEREVDGDGKRKERAFSFLPWKFEAVPSGFWDRLENRKWYIDWLKVESKLLSEKELQRKHFMDNHGRGLLSKYNDSPQDVLLSLNHAEKKGEEGTHGKEREGKKKEVEFQEDPLLRKKHWGDDKNHRAFALSFAEKMGFSWNDFPKWYNVTMQDFYEHGGRYLLVRYYRQSPYLFLKSVFPEFSWQPWLFPRIPKSHTLSSNLETDANISDSDRNSTDKLKLLREAVKFVEGKCGFKSAEEWRRIAPSQLKALGIESFFAREGGVGKVLSIVYPELRL